MAARRRSSSIHLRPGQADYVLKALLMDGLITPWQVRAALSKMTREIEALEEQLASLRAVAGRERPQGRLTNRPDAGSPARRTKRRGRRRPVSAEAHASHVLQGQYMHLLRQMPATKRATYKTLTKEKGRAVAMTEMRKALKQ